MLGSCCGTLTLELGEPGRGACLDLASAGILAGYFEKKHVLLRIGFPWDPRCCLVQGTVLWWLGVVGRPAPGLLC